MKYSTIFSFLMGALICFGGLKLASSPLVAHLGERGDETTLSPRYPYRAFNNSPRVDEEIEFQLKRLKERDQDENSDPTLALLYVSKGKERHDDDLLSKGEAMARRALAEQGPETKEANVALMLLASEGHRFNEVERLATEILNRDPKNLQAKVMLLRAKFGVGKLVEAFQLADDLVTAFPGSASYAERAQILRALGREEEALEDFRQALGLEAAGEAKLSAWVRALVARAYREKGQYEVAKEFLSQAKALDADSSFVIIEQAELHRDKKEFHAAELLFGRAFSLVPNPRFLIEQAQMLKLQGKEDEAKRLWKVAEDELRNELADGDNGHRSDLVRLFLHRAEGDDLSEALKLAQEEAKDRADAPTLELLAQALIARNRWPEARSTLNRLLMSGVRNRRFYALFADVEQALGRKARAALYRKLSEAGVEAKV